MGCTGCAYEGGGGSSGVGFAGSHTIVCPDPLRAVHPQSVIEEYAINGLRLPLYGEAEPSEKALYLVGSLANELPDKYSRIGVIFKAVAFLNFERNLAASILQHAWARYDGCTPRPSLHLACSAHQNPVSPVAC